VGGEVVADDDIALFEGRGELGLDIGLEDGPVHWGVDHEWRGQSMAAQTSDECLGLPGPERCLGPQAPACRRAAVEPGHPWARAGFVDEHQPVGGQPHLRLPLVLPLTPRLAHVRPILLAGQQRFF
jgi:hypothetical protein